MSIRVQRMKWGVFVAVFAAAASVHAQTGPEPSIPAAATAPIATPAATPPAPPAPAIESRSLGAPGRSFLSRDTKPATTDRPRASWFGGMILPLAGVLALIVFGSAILRAGARRMGGLRSSLGAGGRAPAGILEILGRYPVGRGVTLVLLKLDSRVLLLSQSAGGRFGAGANFQTLAEITDPEQVASILIKSRDAEGDSLAERFRSMLHRFDREMETPAASPDGVLWDGTRSDIPVIDLTKRASRPASPRPARKRLAAKSGADA